MQEALTWTEVSTGNFHVDMYQGVLFGNGGPVGFFNKNLKFYLGLLNSKISIAMLEAIAPTINYGPEQIKRIPIFKSNIGKVTDLVENVYLLRKDWDSNEISWDFKLSPLISPEFIQLTIKKHVAKCLLIGERILQDCTLLN